MVVVSGTWVKNVATYPTPAPIDMVINNNDNKMTAKAVLICRPNSHPFQERTLTLDQPVKVGRSVARDRASPTNAIFDCKVLSRHHALLWYDNGKFFLQDTKSSNGTFVNNNRLTADLDHHEISSGDIVQFGVDVIENNLKVTHGCIIATFKLYLPDGKEAKASPSIVENNPQVVPLDELYKLHSIIQEATQREQCLETKLMTLQTIVDEARKSAEDSWQAYVGEERLLSRISALETQLQQAGKNWNEDKYKEEINKLQDDSAAYQVAAKEALEKVHAERLQALAMATEQERSRISAEQSILLIKEQLIQTQQELEEVSKKLMEEQKNSKTEKSELEEQNYKLQSKLDSESAKVLALTNKLYPLFEMPDWRNGLCDDDVAAKKELISQNENTESEMNKANGTHDDNRIPLILEEGTKEDTSEKMNSKSDDGITTDEETSEISKQDSDLDKEAKEGDKHVSFNLQEEMIVVNQNGSGESPDKDSPSENEKDDFDNDNIDSKTLKYKYQSAQNELKKRIEYFQSIVESNKLRIDELETCLNKTKETNTNIECEKESLKEELSELQQKWKESCNENQQLKDRVNAILNELQQQQQQNDVAEDQTNKSIISSSSTTTTTTVSCVNYEQFVCLEEELVMLKQRYSQINDEKLKLHHDLAHLKEQYNKMCNRSYDTMYFYIAPLILIIFYLLISAMIS